MPMRRFRADRLHRAARRRSGVVRGAAAAAFTILEVSIAVVIVLALSALAMPSLVRLLERASPGEVVSQVGSAVGMCRADAIRGGRAMALVAVPDARQRWTLMGIPLPGSAGAAEDSGAESPRTGSAGEAAGRGLAAGDREPVAEARMPLVARLLEVETGREEYVTLPSGVGLADAARIEPDSTDGLAPGGRSADGSRGAGDGRGELASPEAARQATDDAVARLMSEPPPTEVPDATPPEALLLALVLPDGTLVQGMAALPRLTIAGRRFDLAINPWTGAVTSREVISDEKTPAESPREEESVPAPRRGARPDADPRTDAQPVERSPRGPVPEGGER